LTFAKKSDHVILVILSHLVTLFCDIVTLDCAILGNSVMLGDTILEDSAKLGHAILSDSVTLGHTILGVSVTLRYAIFDDSVKQGHSFLVILSHLVRYFEKIILLHKFMLFSVIVTEFPDILLRI